MVGRKSERRISYPFSLLDRIRANYEAFIRAVQGARCNEVEVDGQKSLCFLYVHVITGMTSNQIK